MDNEDARGGGWDGEVGGRVRALDIMYVDVEGTGVREEGTGLDLYLERGGA